MLISVHIDSSELAKSLDHDEKLAYIKAIDEVAADYDFTLAVLRDLVGSLKTESGPENAARLAAIAEILDQI
jgi:hypothetical protein